MIRKLISATPISTTDKMRKHLQKFKLADRILRIEDLKMDQTNQN